MDDKLTGHNKQCPKCDNHLTSLYLCPECGIRYDEWYKADQRIKELEISEEKYRMNAMDLEEEKDKRIAELEAMIDDIASQSHV